MFRWVYGSHSYDPDPGLQGDRWRGETRPARLQAWARGGEMLNLNPVIKPQLNLNFFIQMNRVFATDSNFIFPISLQPHGVFLLYFKFRLLDLAQFIIWNIKDLQHRVAKITGLENQSLWHDFTFLTLVYASCWICFVNKQAISTQLCVM